MSQAAKGIAGLFQFHNLGVQGSNPLPGQGPRPVPVLGGIQRQKFRYLLQGETGRLGGLYKVQPADIAGAIAPDPARVP